MPESQTELEKRKVLRMSNEESNKLTKECLHTALIYLMSEKPFDKITISEIVRRSGVSRTAFYRNYSTKEDVLTEMSAEFTRTISASFSDPRYAGHPYQWYCDIFHRINEDAELFRLMLQANLPTDRILGTCSILNAHGILDAIHPSDSVTEHYRNAALEGAFTRILLSWFRDGRKESPETMAEICTKLLNGSEPLTIPTHTNQEDNV